MKLVIVTQAADRDDPNLGAFYYWFRLLADRADAVTIIARRGSADGFPAHMTVHVFDGGQDSVHPVVGRFKRMVRFWELCAEHFADADAVLFHQIPEFVIAAFPFFMGRKVRTALWYAHGAVSWRLTLAERLVNTVFTSSAAGFRLPSKKVIYLGQAINTDLFTLRPKTPASAAAKPLAMVSVGRLSPVKHYETIIAAALLLRDAGTLPWTLTIVGGPLTPGDHAYAEKIRTLVREKGLADHIRFEGEYPYSAVPALLREYDMFLNCSRTGSLDKAVLEAMACGLTVITSNEGYRAIVPPAYFLADARPEALADRIATLAGEARPNKKLREIVVRDHALAPTIDRLASFLLPSEGQHTYSYPSVSV